MPINPTYFVIKMDEHWTNTLGNVSNPGLKAVWKQMAETFNKQINHHDDEVSRADWYVIQTPTGIGKTQGVCVYCSLLSKLPDDQHPGVLIVVRRIIEADTMAAQINTMSGKKVATAMHSNSQIVLDTLKDYPVLVITQSAYTQALDHLGQEGTIEKTWPYFHDRHNGTRKLVIIDEAINVVEHFEAGLDGLRQTLGVIPQWLRVTYPAEIEAMTWAIQFMEHLDASTTSNEEQMVQTAGRQFPDLTPLRLAMRDLPYDQLVTQRHDAAERQRLRDNHDRTMKELNCIFKSWIYYARYHADHALHTAALVVPDGIKGAVVLDATAGSNVAYELFEHAYLLPAPSGVRTYGNVTLHVSYGHNVGKRVLAKNARQICNDLISALDTQLAGRKVLVICHRDVEPELRKYAPGFELNTGHWKAVDGRNDWQDCDAAVIFGLPYMPPSWPVKTFCALQGPQDTAWLKSSHKRRWGRHRDVRQAIQRGQLVTEIVQAINRVRCRRVIDVQGNCPPTDIYLLLPTGKEAEALLHGIIAEMPGIQLQAWDYAGCKRKRVGRSKKHEANLVAFLQNAAPGRYPAGQVRQDLCIPVTTFERLVESLKRKESTLHAFLEANGIQYTVDQIGRSKRAYFVKP